jgi:hypothetical protein
MKETDTNLNCWLFGKDHRSRLVWRLRFHGMILHLRKKNTQNYKHQLNMLIVYRDKDTKGTQQRMMSQITSKGASVLRPRGFTWLPEMRYPALITAERNITADGEVHLRVAHKLWRLTKSGTSGNSCTKSNM